METWLLKCLTVFFVTIWEHGRQCYAANLDHQGNIQPTEQYARHYHHHHYHTSPATVQEYQDSTETEDYDYPYEEIRQYLESNPKLKSYFSSVQIGMRVGGTTSSSEDDGTTLCNIRESKMIFPKKLKNVNNLWRTIINTPDYQQGIETKTCHSEGTTCSNLEGLPLGFKSFCSQQFITRQLMVFNQTTAFELFRFPSCCLCKIKRLNLTYNEN